MKIFWNRKRSRWSLRRWLTGGLLAWFSWTMPACFPTEGPDPLLPFRRSSIVMGTKLEATIYRPPADDERAEADLDSVEEAVLEIDRLMSLYRPDSELARLNSQAGSGPIQVSSRTFQVLQASRHYAQLSGGALDVTVQPLVRLWGFYRMERTTVPPLEEIQAALARVGLDRFHLDGPSRTVTLISGSQLDLGSLAKGYAIDQALSALRGRGVPAALVDLGGNIGVLGQPPGGRSWRVGLQHPRRAELMGLLRFRAGAVATSGDYDRFFEVGGRRFSHLLDPRTGWPAQGLYSVTVVAPTAMAADALSTAAFVLGPERGLQLLSDCRGVEAVMTLPPAEPGRGAAQVVLRTTPGIVRDAEGAFILRSGTEADPPAPGREPDVADRDECVPPPGPGWRGLPVDGVPERTAPEGRRFPRDPRETAASPARAGGRDTRQEFPFSKWAVPVRQVPLRKPVLVGVGAPESVEENGHGF